VTLKSEQKAQTHQAILASAAALLRKQGIAASSVSDVMKGAGLTVGGFYSHFESKEQLFSETIHSAGSEMWDRLMAAAKGASGAERVMNVVRGYLSRSHRDHAELGCILPSVASELGREESAYRVAVEQELAGFVTAIAGMLGKGSREKAIGLIALMYGALTLSRAVAGTPLSDELLKASRAMAARMIDDG
jgi:TetR/AcrR family transcriptional repressor of nem operon